MAYFPISIGDLSGFEIDIVGGEIRRVRITNNYPDRWYVTKVTNIVTNQVYRNEAAPASGAAVFNIPAGARPGAVVIDGIIEVQDWQLSDSILPPGMTPAEAGV